VKITSCVKSPQGRLLRVNHGPVLPPLICPPLYRFLGCSYGPSNTFDYLLPYPISESAEVIPIIAYPCHVRVDHYKVVFVSGEFKPGLLVQDNTWDGPLFVLRYVAEGGLEMVAECIGRDFFGRRVVRFLVVSNSRVHRRWELGVGGQHARYPAALDSRKYTRKAFADDTLPVPGPIFPIPFYPDCPISPPSYTSSLVSSSADPTSSGSLSSLVGTIFHYMTV
jgi:hypothetical protein